MKIAAVVASAVAGAEALKSCNAYTRTSPSQVGLCNTGFGPQSIYNGACVCYTGYCMDDSNSRCTGCANIDVQLETLLPAHQQEYSRYYDGVYAVNYFDSATGRYAYVNKKTNSHLYYLNNQAGWVFTTIPAAQNANGAHSVRSNAADVLSPLEVKTWAFVNPSGAFADQHQRVQLRCRDNFAFTN